jgi:uncharacterized protein YkwD
MRSPKPSTALARRAGLALLLFLLPTLARADAARPGPLAASTAFVYLPVIFKDLCSPAVPTSTDWLAYVNYYRALACLPPVTENAAFSDGDRKHAQYMVKNDFIGHYEEPSLPYYTPEGDAAARNSNVMVSSDVNAADPYALELWMRGPFHAVGILDPKLQQVGFGSYREADGDWQMAAALDVLRGLGSVPGSVTFPVKWPADGQAVNLKSFNGYETPDPLTSCPGYTAPSGLPIILQLGVGNTDPSNTSGSITQGVTTLPSCLFDETNYANPDLTLQNLGRAVLATRDAIVLVPRNSLTPGATYTVSITSRSQTHVWSFAVSPSATALEAEPEALIR